VFHCVVHPDEVAKLSKALENQSTSATTTSAQISSRSNVGVVDGGASVVPVQSTSSSAAAAATSAISTGVQLNPLAPTPTQQQYAPPTNAPPPEIQAQFQQPYSIPIQNQPPQGTPAGVQQTITLSTQSALRPNIQVIPIQYQAVLIKYLPHYPYLVIQHPSLLPIPLRPMHSIYTFVI